MIHARPSPACAAHAARVVLLALLLPPMLPAQEPPPPTGTPPAPTAARRRRPEWKPTLSLPKDLWVDVTAATIGTTAEWTNKVELADVDGDGRPDILFANGGDYDTPGTPVASRVFANRGAGHAFAEVTKQVFGDALFLARVIKVRDVDGDGRADVFVGTTFGTQSRLFLGTGQGDAGKGAFRDATASNLPALPLSVGDAEFGDIDGDGDLDLVLAEWGPGSPMKNDGGRTRLWRNDGGVFTDVTNECMPDVLVRFSWELELVDVDNDFDLDVLVSSKRSPGSFLFLNDGTGRFTDVSKQRLPQFTNNYEFEPMDVDGDGWLDLVTINDGVGDQRFCEHLFRSDGKGGFEDATERLWPKADNPRFDDNMVAFLDYDSNGDADFLIGSLDGPDRLLVNDGTGHFAAGAPVFEGDPTDGTLGIALADLDGDGRLDVVHAQGEVAKALADKVFFGKSIAPDTAAPYIGPLAVGTATAGSPLLVRVRVHDRKSPCMPHDWRRVVLHCTQDGEATELPLQWYGEYLWRATVPLARAGRLTLVVEATDAAGNTARSPERSLEVK
ncbi:MAG TPA: VCBS repeat-containing protein [Planctomycetota bacterium]|nr:VCBS repeat-containing protein [Planctomycetota bacterium]